MLWAAPCFERIHPTLKHALEAVPGIRSAWIFGAFAENEAAAASDIDLLIVGKPDQAELASKVGKAEKTLRREINYAVLTQKELKHRLQKRDPFITEILNSKRIDLIDEAADN
jgi:predicted nucleotidyltransferase